VTPAERNAAEITRLTNVRATIQLQIDRLSADCKHRLKPFKSNTHAVCDICNKYFGWRCQKSPDGVCHTYGEIDNDFLTLITGQQIRAPYHQENEDWEVCLYCNQPDERK
jgi:hypothetical protein